MRASIQDEEEMSSCVIGYSKIAHIDVIRVVRHLVTLAQENSGAESIRRRALNHRDLDVDAAETMYALPRFEYPEVEAQK